MHNLKVGPIFIFCNHTKFYFFFFKLSVDLHLRKESLNRNKTIEAVIFFSLILKEIALKSCFIVVSLLASTVAVYVPVNTFSSRLFHTTAILLYFWHGKNYKTEVATSMMFIPSFVNSNRLVQSVLRQKFCIGLQGSYKCLF